MIRLSTEGKECVILSLLPENESHLSFMDVCSFQNDNCTMLSCANDGALPDTKNIEEIFSL